MSGLEVAGLVLGTLPLAIKAIQSYGSILSSYKNAKQNLNSLGRDLETELRRLENTCERLLEGVAPPSKIDSMIDEPFGPEWKQFNDQLRLRLWRSSAQFEQQVTDMKQYVQELTEKLNVDSGGNIELGDARSLMRELKQNAKFTLKKKDYRIILERIKDGNSVLETLSRQNGDLEPSRKHRSQARVISLIRKLAGGIFNALMRTITCNCAKSHNVGLELVPRNKVIVPGDKDDQVAKDFKFHVLVGSYTPAPNQATSGLKVQRLDILHDRVRWDRIRIQLEEPKPCEPTCSPLLPPCDSIAKKPRRVKFVSPLGFTKSTKNVLSPPHSPLQTSKSRTLLHSQSTHDPFPVSNLCHTLLSCGKKPAMNCIGYITDVERRFGLYPEYEHPSNCSSATLREVLKGTATDLPPFQCPERIQLALALSISVLHLYNTPWLAKTVSLDDVVFLRHSSIHLSQPYNPYRPFVSRHLKETPSNTHSALQSHNAALMTRPVNLAVLSLGALLIQIIIGRSLTSLEVHPDMSMDTILSLDEFSKSLTRQIMENGGPEYASVVTWCLRSAFGMAGFEDVDEFCQKFYEHVVAKLEGVIKTFNSYG